MTYAEFKRRLRRLGVVLDEQGTRHELWRNPSTGQRAPIPRHDQHEVPTGVFAAILRELGISREMFDRG